jgi:hypothetical protein
MENEFSILILLGTLSALIILFVILIYIMKGLDSLIFWIKTKDAEPFVPEARYSLGTVVRHYNVYLKVAAGSGSCKDCYFNKYTGCTINQKCGNIYKRIYK